MVFKGGAVNGLQERGFVFDLCFDLAHVQGWAAFLTKSPTLLPCPKPQGCASRPHLLGLGKGFGPPPTPKSVEVLTPQGPLALWLSSASHTYLRELTRSWFLS